MVSKEKILEVRKKYESILLSIPNVVSVSIETSSFSGEAEEELCLRIYVEKDVDLMRTILAQEIENVKVVIIEIPEMELR
ncbi:hypothetical protein MYX07_04850 [Patescibacteria group bacterium AH-259-L07]|nr:hypothetical protein [Patescibacteria group bacterium AH-259-L07]